MQAFGYITLSILVFVFTIQKIDSANPCSQFSDLHKQSLCSSDDSPSGLLVDEE
jgi:hypothetical protein